MPYLLAIIASGSFLFLRLLLTLLLSSTLTSFSLYTSFGVIELYRISNIASLSPSPAKRNIATSTAKLSYIAFFYSSFIENIIDLDYSCLESSKVNRAISLRSFAYYLILNVVLKSPIEHSLKGDIILAYLS